MDAEQVIKRLNATDEAAAADAARFQAARAREDERQAQWSALVNAVKVIDLSDDVDEMIAGFRKLAALVEQQHGKSVIADMPESRAREILYLAACDVDDGTLQKFVTESSALSGLRDEVSCRLYGDLHSTIWPEPKPEPNNGQPAGMRTVPLASHRRRVPEEITKRCVKPAGETDTVADNPRKTKDIPVPTTDGFRKAWNMILKAGARPNIAEICRIVAPDYGVSFAALNKAVHRYRRDLKAAKDGQKTDKRRTR